MAGSSLYKDEDAAITDINVTPFVDVVLVLLVVFMVTAKLIITRGIDIDKPKAATGGEVQSSLRITIKKNGDLFVNGTSYPTEDATVARIRELAAQIATPKAIVAGDTDGAYGNVMRAIDLLGRAGVTAIALENVPLDSGK